MTGAWLAVGLLVFAIVWLSDLSLTSLSPPVDNIEQLTWVRSLEWGYYKHPPLPTWLLWIPVQVFGLSAWTSYAMGAVTTLGAVAILWRLLVGLRGSTYAGLALLAVLCNTYYTSRLFYYNHNTVLLLLSTACAALCWQAFSTRRLGWWVALGVAVGLGGLAKYQIVVTISSILAFAIHQRVWRDPAHRLGLLCATLVALLLFVPHLEWLRQHDFGPIGYAIDSSLGARLGAVPRIEESLSWLAYQLLYRGLPPFLLLAAAGFQLRRLHRASPVDPRSAEPRRNDAAKALIFAWGVLPLCFMPLVGLIGGAQLPAHWGTPFLLFAVPAAMELAPHKFWDRIDLSKVLVAFLVIQSLMLARSCVTAPHKPVDLAKHAWRNFDTKALAQRIGDPARTDLAGPIRVVIGPAPWANTLAQQLVEQPLVLVDGRFDQSPWVSPDLVERCGAVELGATAALPGGQAVGPLLPGMSWRVRLPRTGATPCRP